MAPKRGAKAKAAAQAPPLSGCTVAVSGTFPGVSQAAIAERISTLGGNFVKSVTQDCTHLIATSTELQKHTAKVKAALNNPNVTIVNLSWIEASEADNAKAPEDDHLVASGSASAAPAPPKTATNGKASAAAASAPLQPIGQSKRSASPITGAPIKKQKTLPVAKAKTKAGPAAKASAPSAARPIPQDEGVNSPTHRVYIGPDGTIYDASLNQTNSSNNNNKFYRIQVCTHSLPLPVSCLIVDPRRRFSTRLPPTMPSPGPDGAGLATMDSMRRSAMAPSTTPSGILRRSSRTSRACCGLTA
jgi:poly [ADP-ribose] polymerase